MNKDAMQFPLALVTNLNITCFRGQGIFPFSRIGKGDQKGFYANSDSIKVVQYINSGEWGQCLVRGEKKEQPSLERACIILQLVGFEKTPGF